MGLDMYLYAEKRFGFCSWDKEGKDNEKFDKLVEFAELSDVVDKHSGSASAYVKVEVGYWRKVNAIHEYFVGNCANGVDECQEIEVYRETLVALKDICGQLSLTKDVEQAKQLLCPKGGFFFGSTEIDEYYFDKIEHTYELLTKILEKTPEDYDFIYRASW
jgi:hypothetical protein